LQKNNLSYLQKMKKHIGLSIGVFLWFVSPAFAQEDGQGFKLWSKLTNIEWEYKYSETFKTKIGFPKFSEEVQALSGKEVVIKGYILPVDTEDEAVIISSLPYSQCFFCGGGGVETVMAVYLKKPRKFNLETVTFRGTLELNTDETGLIYNLKNAVEVPDSDETW